MVQLINALVMKIKPEQDTMLVVSDAGDFWEVPLAKPYPAAGALVQVSPPGSAHQPHDRPLSAHSWQKWLMPIAAACFILLLLGGLNMLFYGEYQPPLPQPQIEQLTNQGGGSSAEVAPANQPIHLAQDQPAYVMAVDINPSLELWLDDNLSYLGATALNEEAAALLANINLPRGTPLVLLLDRLVAAARDNRYLLTDKDNLILTTLIKSSLNNPADLIKLQEATAQVEAALLTTLAAQDIEGEIALRTSTGEALAKAKASKISINKMYVADELVSRGITVNLEEVRGEKIGKMLQETGLPPGQVIKELKRAGKLPDQAAKASQEEIAARITVIKDGISAEQGQRQSVKDIPLITIEPEKPENPGKKELPQITGPTKLGPEKPKQQQAPNIKKPQSPSNTPKVLEQLRPELSKSKDRTFSIPSVTRPQVTPPVKPELSR
ncbi:MAG: hypothetical protein KGZ96_09095 [Clostridia bacterium]|nr:hypothetical protein [Clostridia bacterium]